MTQQPIKIRPDVDGLHRWFAAGAVTSAATPRKGAVLRKKIIIPLATVLMAMLSMSAFAVEIAVCGIKFNASDKRLEKTFEVCPGMELCSGQKLRVSGKVVIGSSRITDKTTAGIYAHHGIDIELMPGSSLHIDVPLACDESGEPKTQYGIAVGNIGGAGSGGVRIYGSGTLSITHFGEKGGGIVTRSGNVMVTDGASVCVQTKSGMSAIVAGDPAGSSGKGGVSVVGALVETTGGNIFANGNGMLLDRAVVNVLSHGSGLKTWGNMTIRKSFCTSIAKSGNALYTRKGLNLDNSIVYALSKEETCVEVTYDTHKEPSVIGKGLYKFVTLGGDEKHGIDIELPLTFDGGKLMTCAPDGYGIHSPSYTLTMNSGLIRNQYSMHIKDEFFVSRELMSAYDLIAGWKALEYETEFDPYSAIESFLGYTLLNWIEAEAIDNPSGQANWMVKASSLKMNGGTILTENTKYGISVGVSTASDRCKVSGGSLQPPIWRDNTKIDSPVDVDGNKLVCVTNAVNGEAYSHVVGGWTAMLPPGYDKSSLYLDGHNNLYFWVPPAYVGHASCTVTLGKNGGVGGNGSVDVVQGEAMPPVSVPTRSGWTFAGYWTTTGVGGVQYYNADGTSVREWDKPANATLWAKWTNKVTFGKNGGTGGDNTVTATLGQPMPSASAPRKSGYVFEGYWTTVNAGGVQYYDGNMKSVRKWDRAGSATLWAKWRKAAVVKVTLGKNGGSGGDNYVTCTEGQPMPTPRTAPKRTGWTFAGYWDTLAQDANGNPTGKQYYDKDMKSVRDFDKSAEVTLWAKWTVRVKLGKNSGTGGDSYVTVTFNQPFPKKAMPTRSGYTFGGYWVSASSRTGQCYNLDGTGTSSMKWTTGGTPTIWALWTKTSSCIEVAPADTAAPNASAAPAAAELAAIPAGLYSGVLADGKGTFWLMLDEPEDDYERTAYIYVASEDDVFTAECTAEEAGGALLLTTEDGTVYAFDPVAGTLVPAFRTGM